MFVNAWIVQPEDKAPGDYPSGGPQAHMHDVWRAGAPRIDLLCPDIYLPDFAGLTAEYTRAGNTLFVPESFSDLRGAANAFYAIGAHSALGYSPFAIDRVARQEAGRFENGKWIATRLLGGDDSVLHYDFANLADAGQSGSGVRLRAPGQGIQKGKLHRYQ